MDSDSFIYQIASISDGIIVNTPSVPALISIILAGLLLILSGFASASEIAFFSLSPSDLNTIEEDDHQADKLIKSLLGKSEQLLATILITNNFVNVTIIMLCNFFFMTTFQFGSPVIEFLCLTVILTFLLLLFGEIMPKIYSAQRGLAFCRFAAPGISFFKKVFKPFVFVLVRSSDFMNKYLAKKKNYTISVDELSHALELTDKADIFEENTILEGIIRFGGETAKEVMTSRLDMIDLDIKTSYEDVMKCIIENVYSRIPIYNGTRDNIVGVLYIKDLLPHISKQNFRWQSIIRPAYFVPETKMIDDLLRDFQANRVHIAIVVDEFGGTSGLITMEDIIEEIVGEIQDEYDEEENTYKKIDNDSWIFEAKTQLSDFYKVTGLDEEVFDKVVGSADTIGGLLLEIKGEFPELNEVVSYNNFEFKVLAKDNRRILKVRFTILPLVIEEDE